MTTIDIGTLSYPHPCRLCDATDASWNDGLCMHICERCALPTDRTVTSVEHEAFSALAMIVAGQRWMKAIQGSPVSVWFLERYERLGLKR